MGTRVEKLKKMDVRVANFTQRLNDALGNVEHVIDGSSGALKRREEEGWFNLFYILKPDGGALNYFFRDVRDVRVFVEVCTALATVISESDNAADAVRRFCFQQCFVYRTNNITPSVHKPWFMRMCIDFDTPEGSDKTQKPERLLSQPAVEELIAAIEPFFELPDGVLLTKEPFYAFGSNAFADKSVSLHLIFTRLVYAKMKEAKMTKPVARNIGELAICKQLYVEPDMKPFSSGMKAFGFDKPSANGWRGDAQWLVAKSADLSDEWTDIYEQSCIVVNQNEDIVDRAVTFKSLAQKKKAKAGPQELVAAAPAQVESPLGTTEERLAAAFPEFANVVLRTGSSPNIFVPCNTLWCPYKKEAHAKVKVGFFVLPGDRITIRCFSGVCENVDGYPITLCPPEPDAATLEDRAAAAFRNYVQTFLGGASKSPFIVRLPQDYEDDFAAFPMNAFHAGHREYNTWVTKPRRQQMFFSKIWDASRHKRVFQFGFSLQPTAGLFPGNNTINTWRGFYPGVVACSMLIEEPEVECMLILRHIKYNICGGHEPINTFVLNWLAFGVNCLDRKPGVALWLKGLGGQGKNAFWEYVQAFAGKHHSHKTSDIKALTRTFNGHLARARFLLLDEQAGRIDEATQAAFNDFITAPRVETEEKYMPRHEIANYACIIGFSNKVFSGQRQDVERRYQTLEVRYDKDVCGEDKFAFFAALERERLGQGAAAFFAFLRARDVNDWIAERHTVATAAGWMDMIGSMTPLRKWWFYVLKRGSLEDGGFRGLADENGDLPPVMDIVWGGVNRKATLTAAAQRYVPLATPEAVWQAIKQGWEAGYHPIGTTWYEPEKGVTITLPLLATARTNFQEYYAYGDIIWSARETF